MFDVKLLILIKLHVDISEGRIRNRAYKPGFAKLKMS